MARVTDTRAQVRKLADELAAAGTTPTPTLIKRMLGKGSPNTIVDELAKWREERQRGASTAAATAEAEVPAAAALERVGAAEAAKLVQEAAEAAAKLKAVFQQLSALVPTLEAVPSRFESVLSAVNHLAGLIEGDRQRLLDDLQKANARYDGVQRYAMLAIDAAREEARVLRERLKESGDGGITKESVYKRQIDELRLMVATLKGRLEERGLPHADVAIPPMLTEDELNSAAPWQSPRALHRG